MDIMSMLGGGKKEKEPSELDRLLQSLVAQYAGGQLISFIEDQQKKKQGGMPFMPQQSGPAGNTSGVSMSDQVRSNQGVANEWGWY